MIAKRDYVTAQHTTSSLFEKNRGEEISGIHPPQLSSKYPPSVKVDAMSKESPHRFLWRSCEVRASGHENKSSAYTPYAVDITIPWSGKLY